jgi:hypothetical protein
MQALKLSALMAGMFFTQYSFAGDLPVISLQQLRTGSYWTWTYYTSGDHSKPDSSEKYEVIGTQGSLITFEMSSRHDEQSPFTPHTRFKADVSKCYRAFNDPKLKLNFMIHLYPRTNGIWETTPIPTRATAFEEKFNCNPIVHSSRNSMYETRFEGSGPDALFQQWPKAATSQLRSFYYLNYPGLEGVAYRKHFNPNSPHYYEMRLTDWGR